MTDGVTEEVKATEELFDPSQGDSAFAQLMDTLVSEEGDEAGGESGAEAPPPEAGSGSPAPAAEGAGAEEAEPAAPADGVGGEQGVPSGDADTASGGAGPEEPARPGVDAASLKDDWVKVLDGFEKKQQDEARSEALEAVRSEYSKYFDAVQKAPRLLVGEEVPSLTGDGMERLRDSADAKDWQEAIKHQLAAEVQDRVSRALDDNRATMTMLHGSVDTFRNNVDLIPGTKQFDPDLAKYVVPILESYWVKDDNGKRVGFAIDVQPIINAARAQVAAQRISKPATPAAPAEPTPQQQRAAEQPRNDAGRFHNEDAPQAGISSKAGNSSDGDEDFSALFGTLGLPGLRI